MHTQILATEKLNLIIIYTYTLVEELHICTVHTLVHILYIYTLHNYIVYKRFINYIHILMEMKIILKELKLRV